MSATFAFKDSTYLAITEAALRRKVTHAPRERRRENRTGLLSHPESDGTKVVRPLLMETSWRVVMVSDRAGALLESNVLYCLNAPSVIKDTSWIKPGNMTWF
jgi:alpha-glucosidase